ncbi:hypothetical protein D3C72_1795180 [compost metagenome]
MTASHTTGVAQRHFPSTEGVSHRCHKSFLESVRAPKGTTSYFSRKLYENDVQICNRRPRDRAVLHFRLCTRRDRRRRQLPRTAVREVGFRLQQGHRRQDQLPVGRLGCRPQADRSQDRRLRRFGRSPEGRRTASQGPDAVPHRHRRRDPRGQHHRHQAGRAEAQRPGAGRHLPGQDHQVERPRHQGTERFAGPA